MLVLFETPAGFALFKVLDEGKLSKVEDLWKEFTTAESARQMVNLKAFSKFENTAEALSSATLLIDGRPSKALRKFLRLHCQGEELAVADSKLGNSIKEKLQLDCVHNTAVMEVMRGVRCQLSELVEGLSSQELGPMSLGLSHSLSRYKLRFSPEKVDTMIIQAVGLLDDLDKELNTYSMRVREWYGWHFPELTKIIQDNILYARAVKLMGERSAAAGLDFSEFLTGEIEAELKRAAVVSMGSEVSDLDMANVRELCEQVMTLWEYRGQLFEYLKSRMGAVAPNLTALVGELVGARLIAHGGSLLNLAKQPGSTVQILGAERALFRAFKAKHATPKYGLIYQASLIGQAAPKFKGRMSRSLAAKSALAVRYDALGDDVVNTLGLENRAKLELRLRRLEGRELAAAARSVRGKPLIQPYDKDRKPGSGAFLSAAKTYNPQSDLVLGIPRKADSEEKAGGEVVREDEKERKKKKKKKGGVDEDGELGAVDEKKKKKKKKPEEEELVEENGEKKGGDDEAEIGKKKRKRVKHDESETPAMEEKKNKKKKKHRTNNED